MNLAPLDPSPFCPPVLLHRSRVRPAARRMLLMLALCCPLWLSANALAAPAPKVNLAPTSTRIDEEETFDQQLREFGYWSGAAYTCTAADQHPEVERKVLEAFQRVARLFGTDRAFFYAAAFGRGTSLEIDKAKCPEFLERFRKATVMHGGIPQGAR